MMHKKIQSIIIFANLLITGIFPRYLPAEDPLSVGPPRLSAPSENPAANPPPELNATSTAEKTTLGTDAGNSTLSTTPVEPEGSPTLGVEAKPETADKGTAQEAKPVAPDAAKSALGPTEPSKAATKPETPQLTPEQIDLRENIRNCLGYYFQQCDSVSEHSPWGIMHNLIAYGVDTQVFANGEKANAIGYLCWNGNCRGQQLFYLNRGRIEARLGPGVQGHAGQFLSMLAQSRVKADYPMHVEGRDLTIADLIKYEMRSCEAGTELTFKLIALAHYLDTDTKWRNDAKEEWSIPRLIKEELAQPIIGAACGGTHRLMGFNYAVKKREKEGKPMTGQWKRARIFLNDYFDYTFYLQNDDGSFSTDHFRGRNAYGDINLRLETTGHILEWFVASLSNEQLRDPRVTKGVSYLTKLLLENRRNEWEIGPKGHALHALAIYSERMYGDKPGGRDSILARGRKRYRIEEKTR